MSTVSISVEFMTRKYVSATVYPGYRNTAGELGRAMVTSYKYAWRTAAGEWSQSFKIHRESRDGKIPPQVTRAALVAAIDNERRAAEAANRRTADLMEHLTRFDNGVES